MTVVIVTLRRQKVGDADRWCFHRNGDVVLLDHGPNGIQVLRVPSDPVRPHRASHDVRAVPARAASRSGVRHTLMVQDVLGDDGWAAQLTDADRRGLTPLFWTHAPYGKVKPT